jgi:hypothetical protein
MSQQIEERRVQSLSKSDHRGLRQAHEDARDPGVEIGCGFLDVCAQCQGEAFVGFRLAFLGAKEAYEQN